MDPDKPFAFIKTVLWEKEMRINILNVTTLMAHNWQKMKIFIPYMPCYKIYRVAEFGLLFANYAYKLIIWFLLICEIWGNFVKICDILSITVELKF